MSCQMKLTVSLEIIITHNASFLDKTYVFELPRVGGLSVFTSARGALVQIPAIQLLPN